MMIKRSNYEFLFQFGDLIENHKGCKAPMRSPSLGQGLLLHVCSIMAAQLRLEARVLTRDFSTYALDQGYEALVRSPSLSQGFLPLMHPIRVAQLWLGARVPARDLSTYRSVRVAQLWLGARSRLGTFATYTPGQGCPPSVRSSGPSQGLCHLCAQLGLRNSSQEPRL